jgi:hypothetical protein
MGTPTRKRKGTQLFNANPRGRPRTPGTGYGSAEKARKTLKLLKGKPWSYQRQVIGTLYYRAKYHKYQTRGMREAMGVFKEALNSERP